MLPELDVTENTNCMQDDEMYKHSKEYDSYKCSKKLLSYTVLQPQLSTKNKIGDVFYSLHPKVVE